MNRLVLTVLGAALLAPTLSSQSLFRATLDGTQEVPAVTTLAGGWAKISLDTSTNIVTYDVRTWGLSGTVAHFHNATTAIEFALTGGPTQWTGTQALTPAKAADMQEGTWYVNVHTAGNPAGEIRGAILPRPALFGARLNSAQEVPVNGTAATGTASATLNANGSVTYNVTVTGMTGSAAHFHQAPFGSGVPGSIEVVLSGGPTTWSGTSLPLSAGQIEDLQTRQWYVNVHSIAFPGGQIRGQLVPAGIPYGPASDPTTGEITLAVTGTPADYTSTTGTFTVAVTNGKPSQLGFMFVSFVNPAAQLFKDEPLVVDLGSAQIFPLALSGTGTLTVPVATPALPLSFSLYMQFFGLDATAPNTKFNVSNGVEIPFTNF